MSELEPLLEQFKAAYEAGESPTAADFLDRAPEGERQALERGIDSYLMTAPRRAWDPDAYAASPARESVERVWGTLQGESGSWPELLPHLRKQARLKRSDLVRSLAKALGVADREKKVALYYHRMEHGRLDPEGVSSRVLDALGTILDTSAEMIRSAGAGGSAETTASEELAAFTRTAELVHDHAPESGEAPAAGPESEARDEVDDLFTAG